MTKLLRRLKFVDSLTTTLTISRAEFVNRLNEITDEGSMGIMSDTSDIFSSSKNEFKGQVSFHGFKIKRRRKFFDANMNSAVAEGSFIENDEQLIVNTDINGMNSFFTLFYVLLIIFYLFFIIELFASDDGKVFVALPLILFHGLFMFAIPYFVIRRSVKRLKYELEREFFYLTRGR